MIAKLCQAIGKKIDLIVACAWVVALLACKVDILGLPLFWDEILCYAGPARQLAQDGLWLVLPGLGDARSFFYHPPVFPLTLAFFYTLFGDSVVVARSLSLCFTWILLFFTFLEGKNLGSRTAGLVASAFIFCTPIIFSQSVMFLPEIPLAAFMMVCLFLYRRRHWRSFALIGYFTAMLRLTSPAISLPFFLFSLIEKTLSWRSRTWCFLPLLGIPGYFICQRLSLGAYFNNAGVKHYIFEWATIETQIKSYLQMIFWWQNRHYLTVFCLFFLVLLIFRKDWRKKEFLLYGSIILLFLAGLAPDIGTLHRYLVPIFPLFYLFAAYGIFCVFRSPWLQLALAIPLCALLWQYKSAEGFSLGWGQEDNMNYVEVIKAHQMLAEYLNKYYAYKTIAAPWPIKEILKTPHLGYSSKALNAHNDLTQSFDLAIWNRNSDREFGLRLEALEAEGKLRRAETLGPQAYESRIYLPVKP